MPWATAQFAPLFQPPKSGPDLFSCFLFFYRFTDCLNCWYLGENCCQYSHSRALSDLYLRKVKLWLFMEILWKTKLWFGYKVTTKSLAKNNDTEFPNVNTVSNNLLKGIWINSENKRKNVFFIENFVPSRTAANIIGFWSDVVFLWLLFVQFVVFYVQDIITFDGNYYQCIVSCLFCA